MSRQSNAPLHGGLAAVRRRLADGSEHVSYPDGSAWHHSTAAHLFAEAAASGELTQIHDDGTEERLPANPDAVFCGVRGRDVMRARQQLKDAAAIQQVKRMSAARSPQGAAVRMTSPRPRGAGRPARRSSSARSGDSDDSDGSEPEPPGGFVAGDHAEACPGLGARGEAQR